MNGKTCIITGATSGIGRATANELGVRGAALVLLGRNERAGAAVVAHIQRRTSAPRVEFIPTDLAHQASVRESAQAILSQHAQIDVLINNAGARNDTFQRSADGAELTFAANHLGHFLLTALLLERLLQAPAARIITVSSQTHASANLDHGWETGEPGYDRKQAYARSKLANLMFAYALAHRLDDARAISIAVDPGVVASGFARNNGLVSWLKHLIAHGLRRELSSPAAAAKHIARLALDPEVAAGNGRYYRHGVAISSSAPSLDPALARDLWRLSVERTGLDETLGPIWKIFRP